jgi:hypothetical protein
VTAKPSTPKLNPASSSSSRSEPRPAPHGYPDTTYIAQPDEPCRMQVRLVTAELARNHAKETPKDSSEPTNGVLAFEGEFISGNTTLVGNMHFKHPRRELHFVFHSTLFRGRRLESLTGHQKMTCWSTMRPASMTKKERAAAPLHKRLYSMVCSRLCIADSHSMERTAQMQNAHTPTSS